jgi:hypothetical protein
MNAVQNSLKNKHPIEYFALGHPSVTQPSINVLNPIIHYDNSTHFHFNVQTDPTLLKRYEKISSELEKYQKVNGQLIEVMDEIRDVFDTEDIDIETARKRFHQLIKNPVQHNRIQEVRSTKKTSKKRKVVELEHTNEKHMDEKRQKINDTNDGKICPVCKKWKPLIQFQEVRNTKTGPYVYEHPENCGYCRRNKKVLKNTTPDPDTTSDPL